MAMGDGEMGHDEMGMARWAYNISSASDWDMPTRPPHPPNTPHHTAPHTMPSFLIYAPDYPESLAKRLSVRPEHVELIHKDIASGQQGEYSPVEWCGV